MCIRDRIDHIKSVPFGVMLVELSGNGGAIEKSIGFLRGLGVSVDVIEDVSDFGIKVNGG